MTKTCAALVSVFLLTGIGAASASDWTANFKTLDTDGSGSISRVEWEDNVQKLKLDPAPTFTAMDTDTNNSIDEDEWAAAEKMAKAFPTACKSSSESWCPKQY
ncbi:hypothetical protein DLM45_03525 [Hyphomicrobium methylovorum]|uniref:hypothetical protein n=1 Tax=Hyphomicrobium methylovorum TaxID=84 RepID=UPI0015E71054|nr:hypothetical protein [Hyphomicrobium methylovorum]MBA2125293.1 hypothetical protein [Hyphomicrobium methylovorum]